MNSFDCCQDVADQWVDAAIFVEDSSLKLYPFLSADFDLDGYVDGADFLTWLIVNGMINPTFQNGDADGDGDVDFDDLMILSSSWGQSGGFANFQADFDRDGDVDGTDFLIK